MYNNPLSDRDWDNIPDEEIPTRRDVEILISFGVIVFILGMVIGSVVHDWLYNHAH